MSLKRSAGMGFGMPRRPLPIVILLRLGRYKVRTAIKLVLGVRLVAGDGYRDGNLGELW